MKPEVGRRVFVGSVVAGLPLVAGWKAGVLAQSGRAGGHDHAAGAVDPVIEHIARQIGVIHNAAQAGPRGEHARALASQLRMLAVYGRQLQMDDQVRAALRDLVAKEGRNAILFMEPDRERRQAEMQRYGFQPDPRVNDRPIQPTYQAREAALDGLLQGGITPEFDRLAAVAERIARPLDRSRRAIVSIQDDAEWWRGFCDELWNQYQQAQLIASPFCLAAKYFDWAIPACAALEGGASVLLLVWFYQCVAYRY